MTPETPTDAGVPQASATWHGLVDEAFAAGRLPAGWFTDTPWPRYEPGAWQVGAWDGVIIPLPGAAWNALRLTLTLSDLAAGASAYAGTDGRTGLALALWPGPTARHHASDCGRSLATSTLPAPLTDGQQTVVFTWTASDMSASVNGQELLRAPNARAAQAGGLHLALRRSQVRRVLIESQAAVPVPGPAATVPAKAAPWPLEVTVDFNDDLMACAWSHETFEALFRELRSWGTRRVSWIDLGRAADGYFDHAPLGIAAHARETQQQVGDIFNTAVATAHRHGLECYGILKPFDMAIHTQSWPPRSPQALAYGRIARIGCSYGWATWLAAHNQHLLMARRPAAWGPARQPVWTRLELVKDDDSPVAITPADLRLLVSDDNEHFTPYPGPLHFEEVVMDYPLYRPTPNGPRPGPERRRARVWRLRDLELRAPFVALAVSGTQQSFANRLSDLVHVFGPDGEETHLTYGLTPRGGGAAKDGAGGFEYNRYPGSPSSASHSGGDPLYQRLALDRGQPAWLALARGKDRGPLAVLSPSFPETRRLWLTWITAMLDAGADGIDLRPGHHHGDFTWNEYGFEVPVRDEMRRLTGVDIWATDDFDQALWRRVRGAGWTTFIREASALVRGRGKRLILHLDANYDAAPGHGGAMNLDWAWRAWLREGLADGVTGKALWPGSVLAREVLDLAHGLGLPVSFTPYCNNYFETRQGVNHQGESPPGCTIPVGRLLTWGQATGFDSFNFYECASALRARPDGTIAFRTHAEPLAALFRQHCAAGAGGAG